MNIGLYEKKEAQRMLADFREIKNDDCICVPVTPLRQLLLVFNCPEAKGLKNGEDIILTPSTSFPTFDEPAKLYLDIEVLRKSTLKVFFDWQSIVFEKLLESDFLVFLSAKKPDNKPNHVGDLVKFLHEGHLSIEVAYFYENLKNVIMPIDFATQLFSPIKAKVH